MSTAKSCVERSHSFGVSGPIRRLAGLGSVIVVAPQVRQRWNNPGLPSISLPCALKSRLGRGRLFTPVVRVEHCDLSARHDSSNMGYGAASTDYLNFSDDPPLSQRVAKQATICSESRPRGRVVPDGGKRGDQGALHRYLCTSGQYCSCSQHSPAAEFFSSLSRAS